MKTLFEKLNHLNDFDFGSSLLSFAILIGFFLVGAVLFRSVEIPLRIYLDKKNQIKRNNESIKFNDSKGF